MKPSPSPHDIEAEFADVIESLELENLSLRSERRAVVLAAFEQACTGVGRQSDARFIWAYAAGLAATIVALAYISYTSFIPKPNSDAKGHAGVASDRLAGSLTQPEHPALCELNVSLAIINARAAAAEQELAWLTAMRDEAGWERERFGPQQPDSLNHQP